MQLPTILKTEASNLEQDFIETMISELTKTKGLHKVLTPFGGSCLSHQNKRKSFVVMYMENAIISPPVHRNRQCL